MPIEKLKNGVSDVTGRLVAGSVYAGRVTIMDESGTEISSTPVTLRY